MQIACIQISVEDFKRLLGIPELYKLDFVEYKHESSFKSDQVVKIYLESEDFPSKKPGEPIPLLLPRVKGMKYHSLELESEIRRRAEKNWNGLVD